MKEKKRGGCLRYAAIGFVVLVLFAIYGYFTNPEGGANALPTLVEFPTAANIEIERTATMTVTTDLYADIRNQIINIEGVEEVENISIENTASETNASVSIIVSNNANTPENAVTIYGIIYKFALDNFDFLGEYNFELYMTLNGEQSRWTPAGGYDWTVETGETTEIVSIEVVKELTPFEELFLNIDGVDDVTLASERERDTQVNGLAMVTIAPDVNLIDTRNSIWGVWSDHASVLYPDKRLVLDLTIMQGSTETIWQFTSNSTEWLQLK